MLRPFFSLATPLLRYSMNIRWFEWNQFSLSTSSNLMSSLMSTSSSLVIFNKVSNGGCDELVHHLDTVVGAHPSCLESQRLDFFFSTNITFSLLRSFFAAIVFRLIFGTKIHINIKIKDRIFKKVSKSCDFSEFHSLYMLKIDKSCVKKWLNRTLWV